MGIRSALIYYYDSFSTAATIYSIDMLPGLFNMVRILLLSIYLACSVCKLYSQTSAGTAGQINYRIESHKYDWQVFHTPSFHLYFPRGADSLPAAIAKEILPAKALLAKRMGATLQALPVIIIYPSLSEQYESSIGSHQDASITVPTFVFKGNRIVLHYNGSYSELNAHLRLAMARAIWERELGQGTLGAQVKGILSKDAMPDWYREGAIAYFANGWRLQDEERLRQVYLSDSPASFYQMASWQPALTGAAFNYYLSQAKRADAPLQIFYLLRQGKSLERTLRLVTKRRADSLYAECYQWFRERFQPLGATEKAPANGDTSASSNNDNAVQPDSLRLPYKKHHKGKLLHAELSPDRQYLALSIAFADHKRFVYLYDLKTHTSRKVATYMLPPWFSDHDADQYPIVTWESDSKRFLAVYPYKGQPAIYAINRDGGRSLVARLPLIDGVRSLIPLGNEQYLLSAWIQGQSDLVIYDVRTDKFLPLTNDAADDFSPALANTGDNPVKPPDLRLYFSSARKGDTALGQDTLLLRHGIYSLSDKAVTQVLTDTTAFNTYSDPILVGEHTWLVSAMINGRSRIALLNHQTINNPDTPNAALHIISDATTSFQYMPQSKSIAFFKPVNDHLIITYQLFDDWVRRNAQSVTAATVLQGPWLTDYYAQEAAKGIEDSILQAARAAGGPSFLNGVLRNAGNTDKKAGKQPEGTATSALSYSPKEAKTYVLQLFSAYFSATVNNDYFVNRYQPYSAFQGSFKFPEVGGMVSAGLSDLFEHHHISFAYRLPAGSEGSMFHVRYGNTAKRLNWSLAWYRNVESIQPDSLRVWVDESGRPYPGAAKVKTHYYELSLTYPLSYYTSIGSALSLRKDRTVFLATDRYSLPFPMLTELWTRLSSWGESNHIRPTIAGLYKGWQAKAVCDVFKGFTGTEPALSSLNLTGQWHQPLYKYITLVIKAQFGGSGGDKKVLYNLGGVDNNLTPQMDTTIHFRQNAPYAFQTLVTPLRGYLQNELYGSKYALLNADVYFPLFQTLIPLETNFTSINKLQVGFFADAVQTGGDSRYAMTAKGLRYSYGASARTVLAGYPLRFDIAWPSSFANKPIWYLSINLL